MRNYIIIMLFISLNQFQLRACICETAYDGSDSTFNSESIYNRHPVVFIGEYIGWDYYNARVFKVIRRYKGLGEEVQFMTLRSNACNLHEKVGEQFLVAAYFDRTDSVFMSYSNCTGTFRINNEKAKNKLAVFRKMTAQNGQLPIDLDNRYIKDQKQALFNSAYYNFVLRDDDGIPIPFDEQAPTSSDQSRTYSTGNLVLYISLAVSILFNALLFLKLRRQEKTHHD